MMFLYKDKPYNSLIQFEMDDETIRILINKIQNGLPDIKMRSIATLYTKITVGIIDHNALPKFVNLPGVILQWINDNRNRSEALFKMLTILSYYMKTEEGLLIMKQYQALQFFQQYRKFLLEQQPRQDQYTTLLENLAKLLLPLESQTDKSVSQIQAQSNLKIKQEYAPSTKQLKQKEKSAKMVRQGVKVRWIMSRQPLGKKQQDELYSVMMELKHSKRELQLQWLKKIESLVKYWGCKWFRFRNELINQLTQHFSKSNLRWLIIDILKALVRGIGQNSRQLLNQQSYLVCLNGSQKYIRQPQVQKISISLKKQLFSSIYSYELIDQLIKYNPSTQQSDLYQFLLEAEYKFSPKYFQAALQNLLQKKQNTPNLQLLNKNIDYYCSNFNHFPQEVAKIISKFPIQWKITAETFPSLKKHAQSILKNQKISFLAKYRDGWQLGNNLHNIGEVMGNLKQGIQAIDLTNYHHFIPVYVNALLTLGIAVEKQDPIMSHYPLMKSLIIDIARKSTLRKYLLQEIRKKVNSTSPVKYGSKKVAESDLTILIFSEQTMFKAIFYEAFGDESSLQCWLEIAVILANKSRDYCELSSYSCIFFSLMYHKNEKIKFLGKQLVEGLSSKGKLRIKLCRLFSVSEEQRMKTSKELFGQVNQAIVRQLQQPSGKTTSNKKLLKISQNTIQNYIQIIFNPSLQDDICLNAAKQLLQSLERIQLNARLEQLLTILSERIIQSLNQVASLSRLCPSLFIQINSALNQILQEKYYLKVEQIINLLKTSLQPQSISIQKMRLSPKAVRLLLEQLYLECFQTPFSMTKETHFSTLLYPHLNLVEMKTGGYSESSQPIDVQHQQIAVKGKLSLPNYEETLQYTHFLEWAMYANLNYIPIKLNQTFVNVVQKQIGTILHANKGYNDLNYLAYGFLFLSRNGLSFPDKILDYSSPLLNSLLGKDQSPFNCEPIATIISIIGCKKTRQLSSLLASNPSGIWKYPILLKMEAMEPSLLEIIIKGLIGINYGQEAVFILRLVIMHAPRVVLNEFSQSLLLSQCIKCIRQQSDELLRNTAICLLTEIYKTKNLYCQGCEDVFSSIATLLLDQVLTVYQANLVLNLIRTMITKDKGVFQQINIIKLLLQKLVELILIPSLSQITASIVLEIICQTALSHREMLKKFELVDISINIISAICQKKSILSEQNSKLMTVALDYIFIESSYDESLTKYLLTSTNLLKHLIKIAKSQQNNVFSQQLLQSMGRIVIKLSNNQEDLFLYKLNQILSSESASLLSIVAINLDKGGLEYLKMIGWLLVVWVRNRQLLDPQIGRKMAEIALASEQPIIIKSIMPFSIQAKIMFMESKYFQQIIKENNAIIDNRLVKQLKDKKKKNKVYILEQKQLKKLHNFLSLITALFYSAESLQKQQIRQSEGLKKILVFIEKMYSCGQWDEEITRSYLKLVTNMALSQPFSTICSNRFLQNVVMVQEMIGCILKSDHSDGQVKLSLKLMSALIHFQSIRSAVLRAKVIEQLSLKIIKNQQNGDINLEYIMDIIDIFTSFSAYKDSNTRILNDKRLLEVLLRIIKLGKFSILQEKIVILLANLACFKSNKSTFMSNREIHKIILGLLEDKQISYHPAILSLLYNIIYKNSAALKLYRRNDVIEVIKSASANHQSHTNTALLEALLCQQTN